MGPPGSLGGNAQRGAPDGDATSNGRPMLTLSDQGRGPSSASPNFNASKASPSRCRRHRRRRRKREWRKSASSRYSREGRSPGQVQRPEARLYRHKQAKGRRKPGNEPAWQTDSRRLRRALNRPSPPCVVPYSSSRRREHNTLSHQQSLEGLLAGRLPIDLAAPRVPRAGSAASARRGLPTTGEVYLGERRTRDRRGRRPIGTFHAA